jgi:cellulose synthase/poly-beta-1,6-N-acetylglucosamine synthase-like glycosyltransferase
MEQRVGKSKALNNALKYSTGEIIIVSDADCFWPSDILERALPYLSDPSVGAITGIETLLNPSTSWVNQTEVAYNTTVHQIRIGESKTQSTIFFQGGFGAYKRALLNEFDSLTDDSGTALNIVQKKSRTLLIPDAVYFTTFPSIWKSKITIKIRRASQLIRIWVKCLKLLFQGELALSKKICLPEIFLYIFNPLIFLLFIGVSFVLLLEHPILSVIFSIILFPIIIIKKSRTFFVEFVQDNFILLIAFFTLISNKNFFAWKSVEESRSSLTRDILEEKNLI